MATGLRKMNQENNLAIWTKRVQACRSSGLSVKQWCTENGIVPNTYFRWQRKVFDGMQSETDVFYEVPLSRSSGRAAVSIQFNGLTAMIHHGADEETILATLRAMRSC